jgi:hypothetical protein
MSVLNMKTLLLSVTLVLICEAQNQRALITSLSSFVEGLSSSESTSRSVSIKTTLSFLTPNETTTSETTKNTSDTPLTSSV